MGFEDNLIRGIDRRQVPRQALEKAEHALKQDAIDIESFRGFYPDEQIDQDIRYVKEREEGFRRRDNPDLERERAFATVFEGLVHDQGESGEWFGSDAHTIKTSRFDDIANGVDEIVEFQGEEQMSHLALAIDITKGDGVTVGQKLEKIKEEIDEGRLARIKYFESEHYGYKGSLSKVPRVVIGADIALVEELSNLWVSNDKKALGSHPIQVLILKEAAMQLEVFASYAQKQERVDLETVYKRALAIINTILEEKADIPLGAFENDPVYQHLSAKLASFSR